MFAFLARFFTKGLVEDAILQSTVAQDSANSLWMCQTKLFGSSREFSVTFAIEDVLRRRLGIEVPAEYNLVDGRYRVPGKLSKDSPLSFRLHASALGAGYGLISVHYEAAKRLGGTVILASEPIGLTEPEKIAEINEYRARRFEKWSESNGV